MAEPVWIVGVGMTPFGRHTGRGVRDLTAEAVSEALADAGLERGDIGAAFFGNTTQGALEGQLMVGGQIALRAMGFERIPVFNVENACATGATALHLAVSQVRAGAADIALAVGVEKMNVADRDRAMAVFEGAYDVSDPDGLSATLTALGGEVDDTGAGRRSVFMDIYAALARAHMNTFGTTQRQIAAVAEKNHRHAMHNDKAHHRTPLTVEEILAARPLAFPLTVPMCAPITDGAAAVVVCGQRGLRRLAGAERHVRVLACVVGTGVERPLEASDRHITRLLAERAYEEAGVGPEDMDVAELHDATAFAEIQLTELLGLCEPGAGGEAAERGVTTLGGRLPVNPSGGLESKGHPLGATGLAQVYELVQQLRGEGGVRQVDRARIGIAENGGGFYSGEEAVSAITVVGV
ncbi:thiolase family protein [Streptomyces halstedii]|uniref:thiolase family protein n=1 Tax=Streptomyces TaxID=1883 RepID=UPI00048CEF69|nr:MULTISPECIES: thiolase family protein [Streptomyces]MYR72841.1 thiolase family protein [Streptomyces sp. SID4925]MYY19751.1 thiolase family protein [Streptomyces sp. SID4912]SBU95483.1 Acetyl-CoA acetyltransferase [Streptomyces sp. OspMP-M45]SCD71443.1 Acetyl-CoA acetyltransferase [Streptomyces sp. DpondAA-D4]